MAAAATRCRDARMLEHPPPKNRRKSLRFIAYLGLLDPILGRLRSSIGLTMVP
jgi:hypothetical protein